MATPAEVLEAAKVSHENALAIIEKMLDTGVSARAREVTSSMSVDEIIAGTIGTVDTGLDALIRDSARFVRKIK